MPFVSNRVLAAAAMLAIATTAGGCTDLRGHQGYVIDPDLVNSIQPGVDDRQSVMRVLGTPTFKSEFSKADWYYVSRSTRYLAYNNPHPVAQTTLRIAFDKNGTVTSIDRMGMDQIAHIDPSSKTTPTLGRKQGFFQSLFGNIGTVTPGGAGAAPDSSNTGE